MICGARGGFDQGDVREAGDGPACADDSRPRGGLVQITPADKLVPLGADIAQPRQHVAAELPFEGEMPVLRIGVSEILRQAVECRGRLKARPGGEGIRKSQQTSLTRHEEIEKEEWRVKVETGVGYQGIGVIEDS